MEIWEDIKGYEGLYQVSNLGRIKSLSKKTYNGKGYFLSKEKILNLGNNKGYNFVYITKNKKSKYKDVHRLAAQAFIPNPENKLEVNHKNGIKSDNRLENLEWCTRSENIKHSYIVLGNKSFFHTNNPNKNIFGEKNKKAKKVNQYDLQGNFIKTWGSLIDIQRELGFSSQCISKCCLGKSKTSYIFKWKYYE